jgi:hypothetical protein
MLHVQGEFNLGEKLIPKLEGAMGRAAMKCFLIVAMEHLAALTRWLCGGGKLYVDWFGLDLDCGRTLVVHHVQCRMVAS